jgi:hypothetical protein
MDEFIKIVTSTFVGLYVLVATYVGETEKQCLDNKTKTTLYERHDISIDDKVEQQRINQIGNE